MSINNIFTPAEQTDTDNTAGYVNIDEINKANPPKNAVTAVRNLRLMNDGTYRRPPYMLAYDLSSVLPAGYEVMRFCEKIFVDKEGTDQRVLIVAAKQTGGKTGKVKIFINYNYSASQECRNAYKFGNLPAGFEAGWIDLTEKYIHNVDGYNFTYGNIDPGNLQTYQLRSTKVQFNKPRYAYRGWYFIDANGDIAGLITDSIWYNGMAYFKVTTSGYASTPAGGAIGICRFPVGQTNDWTKIQDVSFDTTSANMVRIYTGKGNQTLNLMFIKDRTSFNGWVTDAGTGTGTAWAEKRADYDAEETISYVKIKCTIASTYGGGLLYRFAFAWRTNQTTTYQLLFDTINVGNNLNKDVVVIGGLQVRISGSTSTITEGQEVTYTISKSQLQQKYNGFFFDYDSVEAKDKKKYIRFILNEEHNDNPTDEKTIEYSEISNQLGLGYDIKNYKSRSAASGNTKDKVYSLCAELDGRQVFFLKNLFANRGNVPGQNEVNSELLIDLRLEPWFNPRITGHLMFVNTMVLSPAFFDTILETGNLLEGDGKGYRQFEKMSVQFNDNHQLYTRLITNTGVWNSGETLFPEKFATGISLLDMLHNYYWKSVNVGAEAAIPAGLNLVAYRLDDDAIRKDNDSAGENIGLFSVCISQVQQGNANCKSIMTTERVKQLSVGQPIIAAARAYGSQFLIFTPDECRWEDVIDEQSISTRSIAVYYDDGIVNKESVCAAVVPEEMQAGPPSAPYTSKFSGTYCAGYRSFYTFIGNKRIDLLVVKDPATDKAIFARWYDEYNRLDKSVKEASRVGYLSNNKEVFWYLNGEIRVWSIKNECWTSYVFPDAVSGFVPELDGELYFWTGNKIYKTEKISTSEFKDKGTAAIDWYFEKFYSFGTEQANKIFDKLDWNYEFQIDPATRDDVIVNLLITNDRGIEIINENIALSGVGAAIKAGFIRRGTDLRCYSKWVKVRVTAVTPAIIKSFKGKEIKAEALIAPGTILNQ